MTMPDYPTCPRISLVVPSLLVAYNSYNFIPWGALDIALIATDLLGLQWIPSNDGNGLVVISNMVV
jgi:hypothetical protein